MPTYEYVCDACGHEYERFQSITASPDRTCPKCGKRKVRRKIGIGAGVLFKGTGFYETDYRSDGYSKAAEADRKSSETPKADATKKEGGEAPKADASAPKSDAPKTSPAAKPAKESRVKALHPSREGRGQGNLRRSKPAARRKGGILHLHHALNRSSCRRVRHLNTDAPGVTGRIRAARPYFTADVDEQTAAAGAPRAVRDAVAARPDRRVRARRLAAAAARDAGGTELPPPARDAMHATAKFMTSTSYWL